MGKDEIDRVLGSLKEDERGDDYGSAGFSSGSTDSGINKNDQSQIISEDMHFKANNNQIDLNVDDSNASEKLLGGKTISPAKSITRTPFTPLHQAHHDIYVHTGDTPSSDYDYANPTIVYGLGGIKDHINFTGQNPLIGLGNDEVFVDVARIMEPTLHLSI